MTFSLTSFITDTLARMVEGGETDWRIMQYAASWYSKGVLEDADLEAVQALIAERERKAAEVIVPLDPYADWIITDEGLTTHTVAELEAYMDWYSISRKGLTLKADLVAAILAYFAPVVPTEDTPPTDDPAPPVEHVEPDAPETGEGSQE